MNEITKRSKGQLILAIMFIVFPFLIMSLIGNYFLNTMASFLDSEALRYVVIGGWIMGFAIGLLGIFMLINYFRKKREVLGGERKLHRVALGIEIACPLSFLFAATLIWFPFGEYLAVFMLLFGILSPFIGLVVGIQAFVEAIQDRKGAYAFLSLLAILLPIVVVGTIIILSSTGVLIIRFM